MNNTKSNNIIESLNERRYVTYTFPTDSEAREFCRDNHINTGEIEYDGEYFTVEVRDDYKTEQKKKQDNKPMTEYQVSYTVVCKDGTHHNKKEKIPAYSKKQALTYTEKTYRDKYKGFYTVRDFKVTGERVLDSAGFVDRKIIGV